jgi:hypothetical protein
MSEAARSWHFEPTMTSARDAAGAGELGAWAQVFNRSEHGNLGIAEGLLRDDYVYMLSEVDLRDVHSPSGPESDFDFPYEPADWERDVAAMMRAFEKGWDAPPLFVHLPTYYLADGAHRREALLRLGRMSYSAVCWMTRPPIIGRGQPWYPRDGGRGQSVPPTDADLERRD